MGSTLDDSHQQHLQSLWGSLIERLRSTPSAEPFIHLPPEFLNPRSIYAAQIAPRAPRDIALIEHRFRENYYKDTSSFYKGIRSSFINALRFNSTYQEPYRKQAIQCLEVIDKFFLSSSLLRADFVSTTGHEFKPYYEAFQGAREAITAFESLYFVPAPNSDEDVNAVSIFHYPYESYFFYTPDEIPIDYTTYVKEPKCLADVTESLYSGQYKTLQEFVKDVDLVFSNASVYYVGTSDNYIHEQAVVLKHRFHELLSLAMKGVDPISRAYEPLLSFDDVSKKESPSIFQPELTALPTSAAPSTFSISNISTSTSDAVQVQPPAAAPVKLKLSLKVGPSPPASSVGPKIPTGKPDASAHAAVEDETVIPFKSSSTKMEIDDEKPILPAPTIASKLTFKLGVSIAPVFAAPKDETKVIHSSSAFAEEEEEDVDMTISGSQEVELDGSRKTRSSEDAQALVSHVYQSFKKMDLKSFPLDASASGSANKLAVAEILKRIERTSGLLDVFKDRWLNVPVQFQALYMYSPFAIEQKWWWDKIMNFFESNQFTSIGHLNYAIRSMFDTAIEIHTADDWMPAMKPRGQAIASAAQFLLQYWQSLVFDQFGPLVGLHQDVKVARNIRESLLKNVSMSVDLARICRKNIVSVLNHANLRTSMKMKYFVAPVAQSFPEIVTSDYFQVIKKPMDLETVSRKLGGAGPGNYTSKKGFQSEYETLSDFVEDVRLIFKNAIEFNKHSPVASQGRLVYDAAITMSKETEAFIGIGLLECWAYVQREEMLGRAVEERSNHVEQEHAKYRAFEEEKLKLARKHRENIALSTLLDDMRKALEKAHLISVNEGKKVVLVAAPDGTTSTPAHKVAAQAFPGSTVINIPREALGLSKYGELLPLSNLVEVTSEVPLSDLPPMEASELCLAESESLKETTKALSAKRFHLYTIPSLQKDIEKFWLQNSEMHLASGIVLKASYKFVQETNEPLKLTFETYMTSLGVDPVKASTSDLLRNDKVTIVDANTPNKELSWKERCIQVLSKSPFAESRKRAEQLKQL
jgi:Bromodomain